MATLEQLIIFFLLIGVGVIARKVGVITPGNTPQLTSLVFNFAMPAIILSGITTEQPHISGKDLSIVLTSAFTTLILLIICSRMPARILRYEREYYGVITVMTTFTNVSMMGIPMIYSLYGSEAMIYITVFYGDFIAEKPDTAVGPDKWRSEYEMAKQFVMTVNRHGGDATLVHLPDIGIKGNSHFLMAEKNNQEIAGILASWLQDKGLDK
ncbi:AEC family transporter [Escherichia coli]|uniref:AEC family transporter n=1 Tax=Escherichia coli TaxID=562 RepID=UPI000907C29F|nr:AEC family transporter [Escherichia coli]